MAILAKFSKLVFRRSSSYVLTMIVGAFVFERSAELGVDALWNKLNEGKLWDHIKQNYE